MPGRKLLLTKDVVFHLLKSQLLLFKGKSLIKRSIVVPLINELLWY